MEDKAQGNTGSTDNGGLCGEYNLYVGQSLDQSRNALFQSKHI